MPGCGAHSVSTATLRTVVAKLIASHLYQLNAAVIDGFCANLLLGEGGASRGVMKVHCSHRYFKFAELRDTRAMKLHRERSVE
jgi:hypothetical protein